MGHGTAHHFAQLVEAPDGVPDLPQQLLHHRVTHGGDLPGGLAASPVRLHDGLGGEGEAAAALALRPEEGPGQVTLVQPAAHFASSPLSAWG